jgi:hypothetical protein
MLKQLVELAKAKKQVNIAFTSLTAEKFILGIAPANAGTDKIAPFLAKGTIEEIMNNLHNSANLSDYVTAALAKNPEPVKEADPDEEGKNDEENKKEADVKFPAARCQNGDDDGSRCLLSKGHAGECSFDLLPAEQKCRVCECTETAPCHTESGPCHWVGKDLCSACATSLGAKTVVRVEPAPAVPAAAPAKQATFEF